MASCRLPTTVSHPTNHPMLTSLNLLVDRLQRGLRWRQEDAARVVDQIKLQAAAGAPVPRRVQHLREGSRRDGT